MDAGDALFLARVQFGLNIAFHILFPTISIALAWFLIAFRAIYARTRDERWLATYRLWVKIFALSFAMGVVSGIVMSFQFGTNWPGYMNRWATSRARCWPTRCSPRSSWRRPSSA
jgi:cytochrome bd ubiquinol oxidase subunit I